MILLGVGMALNSAVATPTVSDISVRQRYPWNGLVDLKFTVTGTSGTQYDTSFIAKDMVGGTNVAMKTIRKSDGTTAAAKESLQPGTYNWIWDAAADLPDGFECERMMVTGTLGASVLSYTVKFNANGGTGTMENQLFTYGTAQALTANTFTRRNYIFQGWAMSASGEKVYSDQQLVSNLVSSSSSVVNLYALWQEVVQLWRNGPYWATMNIGADKPSDYGYYFWWGDTVGYKRENDKWVASDGSSSNFSFDSENSLTYGKAMVYLKSEGWITVDGALTSEHDAAQVHWGGNWRMPTKADFEALTNNCDMIKTVLNGIKGCEFRGRGAYVNAKIFFPSAGCGNDNSLILTNKLGRHWSSVPESDNSYAWLLQTDSDWAYVWPDISNRGFGYPVRPIQETSK